MSADFTIAACATPHGKGGVGVVRVSGTLVPTIAAEILGQLPPPRYALYHDFYGARREIIDSGIALYFPAPHSFTGEDVLELQGHGGPVIMDRLLERIIALGARLARPGEFSERAFLNGKIDLTQAEAIADLINATTITAARNAQRSLQGEFSRGIYVLVEELISLRTQIEAAIDFSEDEIDMMQNTLIAERLTQLMKQLEQVKNAAKQGVLLRDGISVVIAGKPNVGKSSLLNCFTGEETAIVTSIPGTTRDVLRSHIQIDGIPLHLLDTAGLHASDNLVEQEGIKRAWNEIKKADHVLWVFDVSCESLCESRNLWPEFFAQLPEHAKLTVIYNKIDLTKESARIDVIDNVHCAYLSAKTGVGIDLLKAHLKKCLGFNANTESEFSARRRHLGALDRAQQYILQAQQSLGGATDELCAEDLRQAQEALSEITGEFVTDDLLGRIFSEFCVGK